MTQGEGNGDKELKKKETEVTLLLVLRTLGAV